MSARDDRIAIGKRRVKYILKDRLYANHRQLESKISEAGPDHQRVDPHLLSVAIRDLAQNGEILEHSGPLGTRFFTLPSFDLAHPDDLNRKTLIDGIYARFQELARKQALCGDALETVVRESFSAAGGYLEIGSKKKPVLNFGNLQLPGELDSIQLCADPGMLVIVEAKNIREWIYPNKEELWSLINKALVLVSADLPVLPVFVSRKIPYYARVTMKEVGVLGFEIHKQYFDPSVQADVDRFRNKDLLGFHDVTASVSASDPLTRYLKRTVKEHGLEYAARFKANAPVLSKYASQLANADVRHDRNAFYKAVMSELNLTDRIP